METRNNNLITKPIRSARKTAGFHRALPDVSEFYALPDVHKRRLYVCDVYKHRAESKKPLAHFFNGICQPIFSMVLGQPYPTQLVRHCIQIVATCEQLGPTD